MLKSKSKVQIVYFFLLAAFFLIFFQSCSSINYQNRHDTQAYILAKKISDFNKKITSSKGIGWLKIKKTKNNIITPENNQNMARSFRIAWAAQYPDKIRITFLSSGFPVETMISNGQSIKLFSHTGNHSIKTYNIKNPSLKDIFFIPVRVNDIITLLTGQIPVKDFNYAFFDSKQACNDSKIRSIILKKTAQNSLQKLFINEQNQIEKYILTDWKIKPVYSINFFNYTQINSASIAKKIIIHDRIGREVSFEISKFYINPPVKTSLFTLTD